MQGRPATVVATAWPRPCGSRAHDLSQRSIDITFRLTVDELVVISVIIATLATAVTFSLAVIGYRAYRRHGTRLVGLATVALGLIALSRAVALVNGVLFADHELSVRTVFTVQIFRSLLFLAGFSLLLYAIFTRD